MNNYVIGDSLISLIKPTVIKNKQKKNIYCFGTINHLGKFQSDTKCFCLWLSLKMYGSLQSDSL